MASDEEPLDVDLCGIDLLNRTRTDSRSDEGDRKTDFLFSEADKTVASIMACGSEHTEHTLQFIRPERGLRRQTDAQQNGNGNQSSAAGDGVDDSRKQIGKK